jgi:hypothetical protein
MSTKDLDLLGNKEEDHTCHLEKDLLGASKSRYSNFLPKQSKEGGKSNPLISIYREKIIYEEEALIVQ